MFRRDRQYFDYDLLGNPNIPTGYSIPIGPSAAPTGSYAWPQVTQSPFMFNTVRRMTDTNLTLLPLSKVTFRFAYSQNIMQGPSLTPSGNRWPDRKSCSRSISATAPMTSQERSTGSPCTAPS